MGVSRHERKASAEAASADSTSASETKSNACPTSPVAGLTTRYVGWFETVAVMRISLDVNSCRI
jgi:hypothetical protein